MTDYYIKNGGDDLLSGNSDANAWATISKLWDEFNAGNIDYGDNIYLKRGSSWTCTKTPSGTTDNRIRPRGVTVGTPADGILIDAYDVGPRPVIKGSGVLGSEISAFVYNGSGDTNVPDNVTIRNIEMFDGDRFAAVSLSGGGTGWVVEDCAIHDIISLGTGGNEGVGVYSDLGSEVEVRNCFVGDMEGECFYVANNSGGGVIYAHDNWCHSNENEACDIKVSTTGSQFSHNLCTDNCTGNFQNAAINVQGTDHIVTYNRIINVFPSGGAHNTYGIWIVVATDCFVENNYIDTVNSSSLSAGIRDNGGTNTKVQFNTITNCERGIYFAGNSGATTEYRNNILEDNEIGSYYDSSTYIPDDMDYNIYFNNSTSDCFLGANRTVAYMNSTYSIEANSFTTDPGTTSTLEYAIDNVGSAFGNASALAGGQNTTQTDIGYRPYQVNYVYQSDPNLISYWTNDQASGNSIATIGDDLTDTNTVGNSTTSTPEGGTYSRDFIAANSEYLNIANASMTVDLDGLNVQELTIETWIYADDTTNSRTILAKYDNADRSYWIFQFGGDFKFRISGDGTTSPTDLTGPAISTGTWQYIVVTYSYKAGLLVYADGFYSTSVHNPTLHYELVHASAEPFRLGARTAGNYWNGMIGPTRFWNRALNIHEINNLYNNGLQDSTSIPVMMNSYRKMRSG